MPGRRVCPIGNSVSCKCKASVRIFRSSFAFSPCGFSIGVSVLSWCSDLHPPTASFFSHNTGLSNTTSPCCVCAFVPSARLVASASPQLRLLSQAHHDKELAAIACDNSLELSLCPFIKKLALSDIVTARSRSLGFPHRYW